MEVRDTDDDEDADADEEYLPHKSKRSSKELKKQMKHVRTYTCKKCFAQFPTRRLSEQHSKSHHNGTKEVAQYKYDAEQELYTCTVCSAEFHNKIEVEDHIKVIHTEHYICDDCGEVFTSAYSFSCHTQQHNQDQKYYCPLCNYNTTRRTCVLNHINRMHYRKFYYYCKTCGKGFNDSVLYKEHDNEHLGLKPFVCVVCHKTYTFSRYLQLHQIRYHTVGIEGQLNGNQCPVCLKIFAKKSTLIRHTENKHIKAGEPREKRHLCDACGKSFATRDKYRIHYRIHTGIKPYTCSYCAKSFIKRDYLVMHERVHTGEKPYSCQHCGKCFNQAAPLRIHVRGHTGERPYICTFCNVGFVSKGSLNMHRKVCTGGVVN